MIGQRDPDALRAILPDSASFGIGRSNFLRKAGTDFSSSFLTSQLQPFLLGARCERDMLGLDGYGSSDDEEEDARVEPTGPTPVATATDLGMQNRPELGTVPKPRVSALPSATAMFDAKAGGVGSLSAAHAGTSSSAGSVLGTKRTASGSFPISGTATKSTRNEAWALPGGKPRRTLLPPQLRGRSNNATLDLEGMGLKRKSGGAKPPSGGG